MSRKWLERETPGWVRKGIITNEQAGQLLAEYDDRKHAIGILPILGSLLVGLGVLSFVAANWQGLPNAVLLVLVLAVMTAFYAGGELCRRRGEERLGLALTAIGLASFGAAMFLVVQKYQLPDFEQLTFVLWGAAGVLLTWVYRSRFLFVLAAAILNVAAGYSAVAFQNFNYVVLVLLVAGLGSFWWRQRDALLAWTLGASLLLQALLLIGEQEWNGAWFYAPALALYALGDWLKERRTAYPLQSSALTGIYILSVMQIMFSWDDLFVNLEGVAQSELIGFLVVAGTLLVVSLAGKVRRARIASMGEWVLLLPWFFVPEAGDLLYLLALCVFSLLVLWQGYAEQWRFKINFGTVLFLFAILLAYTRLAWAFMDKSLFFLIGGVLLLGLSWFLGRRRKRALQAKGGEADV